MILRTLIPALAVAAVAGCGPQYPRLPVVPAEGKVLYRDKPAVGAQVILVPVGDDSPDSVKPRGTVGKDGVFRLATYPTQDGKPDGAPLGEYRVSVRWPVSRNVAADPDEPTPAGPPGGLQGDRLGERYSDPKTSGLTVKVEKDKPVGPIVLRSPHP